ncbi:39S ribosomal protein L40, mitochondrial-like isoform X2 [Agrilus planipennis]|uniref:Large ribosomal subunit protein mL40 n=1 Tax=Agrilus planipennis TaxID=224129 RepID=A0A1W4XBW2_AGRPL|nr:39S ribosomal protein L40, mitochondrial isoform X2 [Agrilus planipennis]XP_025837259.1 39S ribosomal protein L40, mitochondrial-like isoform X2 [Agrilus planipennis]
MSLVNIMNSFSKIYLQTISMPLRSISTTSIQFFKFSPCLMAEPLKKKKKMDPAIIRAREERKKKKIEKQIRRLEKNARQLKPIDECEVPLYLIDEQRKRARTIQLTEEVLESRAALFQAWSCYKQQQHLNDVQMIDRIMYSQQKALNELKNESEDLYQEAIQVEPMLLPIKLQGPSETPPIADYDAPDGDYQDVSRKWD